MPGNPLYFTTSTLAAAYSPWFPFDTGITPPSYAWTLTSIASANGSTGTLISIEATLDNPWANYLGVGREGGIAASPAALSPCVVPTSISSKAAVFTLASGQAISNSTTPILVYPSTAFGFTSANPGEQFPFYAWRVNTTTSSNAVVVTFLQFGKKQ